MRRLWDKGAPLDERVLRYTAGEDYALDERLVPYDIRASLAHAQMLHGRRPADGRATSVRSAPDLPRWRRRTRPGSGASNSPTRTARPRSSGA